MEGVTMALTDHAAIFYWKIKIFFHTISLGWETSVTFSHYAQMKISKSCILEDRKIKKCQWVEEGDRKECSLKDGNSLTRDFSLHNNC